MRGKRSKQYRKLMQQYGLAFGFREPYQVLVDAEMLKDADRYKMDLVGGLERTLHGQVKPMITQCSMRHLYADSTNPSTAFLIDKAKLFERRRCGHLPSDYPEPLSTQACLSSVVDPKESKTNKHRYVVASQDLETRQSLRTVNGVPLVYINRSVMIMEPMAGQSAQVREREESGKFRDGLRKGAGSQARGEKRKREADDDGKAEGGGEEPRKKKKKEYGKTKGPNPLSVKKSKKKVVDGDGGAPASTSKSISRIDGHAVPQNEARDEAAVADSGAKRKRRRKHKSGENDGEGDDIDDVQDGIAGETGTELEV